MLNILKKYTILNLIILIISIFNIPTSYADHAESIDTLIDPLLKQHPGKSGLYTLEKGGEALLARAWLTNRSQKTIDVQYFIWANDNIGKLAAEALLTAAEHGVHVRVLVDDLLITADSTDLFALAFHPNIEIRLYNPVHSVGINFFRRLTNLVVDFRGSNQRMHNKMFIVDNKIAITGGRNMENSYFDFGHEYNYRDRDVLIIGKVINELSTSFNKFWNNKLAIPVEQLVSNPFESSIDWLSEDQWGDPVDINEKEQQLNQLTKTRIETLYKNLHNYARNPKYFSPVVQMALENIDTNIKPIIQSSHWLNATFISDAPGKNDTWFNYNLGGGGESTSALARLVNSAKNNIIIQSPYLILNDNAKKLFKAAINRGVSIKINTNSLTASDNLPAFSGYSAQINELLDMGIELYEFRHDAKRLTELVKQYDQYKEGEMPTFSLHAKTMVIDDSIVFIGSYNLDPRSQNLNTELGIIAKDIDLASEIKREIEIDMQPGNSWNVKLDGENKNASTTKKIKLFFWKLLPIDSIL